MIFHQLFLSFGLSKLVGMLLGHLSGTGLPGTSTSSPSWISIILVVGMTLLILILEACLRIMRARTKTKASRVQDGEDVIRDP